MEHIHGAFKPKHFYIKTTTTTKTDRQSYNELKAWEWIITVHGQHRQMKALISMCFWQHKHTQVSQPHCLPLYFWSRIDDVIKWKYFPRYWFFVREIHWSPVNSPHKGQWRRALLFSLICAWINGWVNNREAGNLRRHRVHCDVIAMNRLLAQFK